MTSWVPGMLPGPACKFYDYAAAWKALAKPSECYKLSTSPAGPVVSTSGLV